MIKSLTKSILLLKTLRTPLPSVYSFSNTPQEESSQLDDRKELNRAENFYRNSIRKININDKGRGIFTEHHLIRLTKLTQKASQLPLLFEGYYNYLGHYTVISSKTVDRMIGKALTFEGEPLDPILEVFNNHNYLSYFPSYETTLKTINAAQKDPQTLHKFLLILTYCPLVKFNKPIVDKFIGMLKDESLSSEIYSRVVKLLIQRSALHIIDEHISQPQLLKEVVTSLEARFTQAPSPNVKANTIISEFLGQLNAKQHKSEEQAATLAILGLFFKHFPLYYANLSLINDQQRAETILNYLSNSSDKIYGWMIKYIQRQQPSQIIRKGVQKLRSNREVSESQENQEQQEGEKAE